MKSMTSFRLSVFFTAFVVSIILIQPSSALVVSELMYHPVEIEGNETLEYIELYNEKGTSEDLSKFTFTSGLTYTFPADTILGPKEYLVLAKDPDAVKAAYGLQTVYGPFVSGSLSNGGEGIEISNPNGGIILSFEYSDSDPWPVSADGAGHSLILIKQGGDPSDATSWAASSNIGGNPGVADALQKEPEGAKTVTLVDIGSAGRYFKGTQEPSPVGGNPSINWTKIDFVENASWLSGNNGYGYSGSSDEMNYIRTNLGLTGDPDNPPMNGNYISVYIRIPFSLTAEQIASFSQLTTEIRYDDDYVLYLNGTRVAASASATATPPPYSWGRGSGWEPPVDGPDLTGFLNLLVPGTNVLAMQFHNNAISGSSDAFGCMVLRAVEKPSGVANDLQARLVINELLANSDAEPGTDWVELYNPGPEEVDLSMVYLSDDRMNLLQYKLPDGIVLQPGEFYSVHQGTASDGFPFGLEFNGETVYLTAAKLDPTPVAVRILDAVRFPVTPPDVTYGRYPDGSAYLGILSSATENLANSKHRIHDIVINEIMYQHFTREDRYEFVELYNRSEDPMDLTGWTFTAGFTYTFPAGATIGGKSFMVVAKDPTFLATVYPNLVAGSNLFGPYTGTLSNGGERIQLSYPIQQINPGNGQLQTYLVVADEVTYRDGGRWPKWSDGEGASMELRDPDEDNNTPDAWADSDESGKSGWQSFETTISASDPQYTHDTVSVFDLIMLNRAEVLLDDLEVIIAGTQRLTNNGFENGKTGWRTLGNHVRSFVTTEAAYSGTQSLHLIATGHGDPGANRINQTITSVTGGQVIFRGKAKWLRGSRYLLTRVSQPNSPVQPPRPSKAFELTVPMNIGTPGAQNTAYVANRGPDIREIAHSPVLPTANQAIVVTARITDTDGAPTAYLNYRSEGTTNFTQIAMVDNGTDSDAVSGDGIFTGVIPGAAAGTMRAFFITAVDGGSAATRFPTNLEPSAEVPIRTCLVRVGDTAYSGPFANYRVWMSNGVISAFTSRPNLSNELMDCTFVYNNKEVFYNARLRFRGSPFIRSGSGRNPVNRFAYRLDFNSDQNFRGREEVNLDNTEGESRGPLQERVSYWFYKQMGLHYSMSDYVRPILNGNSYGSYEEVQAVDTDYIERWFPEDADGYLHKIDDYFEYTADGTGFANMDEGLRYDSAHPRLNETWRWNFEKRGHRENDEWTHLFDFAAAMNLPSSDPAYEQTIEQYIHPEQFARVLAIRHAVGDWDSYGYTRSKNNAFYFAATEGKWYLLPWDIDFTLGSGHSATTDLFYVGGQFPEIAQFLNYPKYRRMYLQTFAELVSGPWKTSYGTTDPPMAFDRYLDDAAAALIADGQGESRRTGIKQFVAARRAFILTQIPPLTFEITTNGGKDFCSAGATAVIQGAAPLEVAGIAVNGSPQKADFSGNNVFTVTVDLSMGANLIELQGLNSLGEPVANATDSITITRVPEPIISSVVPGKVCNTGVADLTILGANFEPGTATEVAFTKGSNEIGFDALYVQWNQSFDAIGAATTLLNNPSGFSQVRGVHPWINLFQTGSEGVFINNLQFLPPYNSGDPSYFAVRFSGYIFAPSAGVRYFGVNSDDGFELRINGQLVGQYASPRGPATTDVNGNRTAGTMTFNFPAAGSYYLELDFFENGGGEEIEFFQTNSTGGNARLINVDAELVVYRSAVEKIEAKNVSVVDEHTITCQADLTGATVGLWNVIVTPECGEAAKGTLKDGFQVVTKPSGTISWSILPSGPAVFVGRQGGPMTPSEFLFTIYNTGTAVLDWSVSKPPSVNWIDLSQTSGTLGAGHSTRVYVSINANTAQLQAGVHPCPLDFWVPCVPGISRQVELTLYRNTDFDSNGIVDLPDWAAFAAQWMRTCAIWSECDGADFDGSGIVDLGDLVEFAVDWLQE